MKTIFIVGISSFVGSNLAMFLKDHYRVIGTYYDTKINIPDVLQFPFDVFNKEGLQAIMHSIRPDVTIYCAGVSSVEQCSTDESYADALNTMGLFNVVDMCQRFKSHLCFISSGYVFSGNNVVYKEMDIPDPSTFYGKNKAAAEFYIQKTSLNYSIYRCCQFYGRGINYKKTTWFEFLERATDEGDSFSCDSFVHLGFLDVQFLGMIIKMGIDKGVKNRLFQLTTSDVMTHYDFAKLYGEIFSKDTSMMIQGKWPFPILPSSSFIPGGSGIHFKMDTRNVEGHYKVELPSIKESLQFTYQRFNGTTQSGNKVKNHSKGLQFI